MAGEPSISFRKYIRWLDGERQEPTSTLVLTTANGFYIDIRVLLPPNFTGDPRFLSASNNTLKIDWAFAGTANSSVSDAGLRTTTWTHWLDSHKPSGFQDSGTMCTQDDGTVLEVGSMQNPATGKEEAYEEVWEDPVPQVVERADGKVVCHAIRLDQEGRKAVVVRVGEWAQGLRIDGEGGERKVTVERWHWTRTGEEGTWKMMFKVGEGEVPVWAVLGDEERGGEWPEGKEKWSLVEHELFKPT